MTTTPTWREALEFAAETKSSDWPERCQKMVDMARKALMSDLKQKPIAWTLKETIQTKERLYRAPLWFTDPQNSAWVPLYTVGAPQQAEAVPQPPEDWSVFNTGAEVATGLTWAEAWDYMTPSRIERGWTAVCVADKSNIGAAIAQQKGQP